MRLTDQEKQLVCRYVQKGKPSRVREIAVFAFRDNAS